VCRPARRSTTASATATSSASRFGGATGFQISNGSILNGFFYAVPGDIQASADLEMFGGMFGFFFHNSAETRIHYDRGVLSAGDSCDPETPDGCDCHDCDNQACIDGTCGPCETSADCCAPLVCDDGVCIDQLGRLLRPASSAASVAALDRRGMIRAMNRLLLAAFVLTTMAGCSDDDDPVSHSEPVGIHLAIADGDVNGTTGYDEKNINTESGNPYGEFAAAATEAIGGEPSRIVVDATTIEIADGSDVAELDSVFDGPIAVRFVMNGSDAEYEVATGVIEAGAGPGPFDLAVDFDSDDIPGEDYGDLATGSFKVVLEGEVAEGFTALETKADFEVVFTFTAYE
jgi:hypothetical protein